MQKIYVCVCDVIYVYNMYVYERIRIYDKCKKYMSVYATLYMYTTFKYMNEYVYLIPGN